MLALLLSVVVQASPSPRVMYEEKCLFCHSEEVTEEKPRTVGQWRQVMARMRKKSPLLITRRDADVITDYIVRTLKLVVVAPPSVRPAPAPVPPSPPVAPVTPLTPPPEPLSELREPSLDESFAPPPPPDPATEAIDEEGEALVQHRCSKCHTLQRVFGKLDSYERAVFTLHRMRLKTGSGITRFDEERIERFLKQQFGIQ